MQQLLSGVEDCLMKGNWFGAVFIAISLPDICGATEGRVKGNGPRYKDWFNRYLKSRYDAESFYDYLSIVQPDTILRIPEDLKQNWKRKPPAVAFTAEDCWSLRNACLHEGVDETRLRQFKLTTPVRENHHTHMNLLNGILQLDVVQLCRDIVEGVRRWLDDMKGNPDVVSKLEKMMTIDNLIFKGFIEIG